MQTKTAVGITIFVAVADTGRARTEFARERWRIDA